MSVEIFTAESGQRYRCVRHGDRWLITYEPKSTGNRGRPKLNSAYTSCELLLSARRAGYKYEAALKLVADMRGVSTRTIIRHWNAHKEILALAGWTMKKRD